MKIIYIFLLPLFLIGCNTPFVSQRNLQQQITELQSRHSIELNQKIGEIEQAKKNYVSKILENFQFTSDWLYGARIGVELVPNKDRLWMIVDNRLAASASYAPPPSREALETMAKTLKEELDEVKISNGELNSKYNNEVKKGIAATEQEIKLKEDLAAKERELVIMDDLHKQELIKLQNKAIESQNMAISEAMAKKDSEVREAIEKNKRIIMTTCGALALIGLACAIWLPVFKQEAAWFAGITGGVALLVPFLQPIHLNILFGLGLLYVLFMVVKKHIESEENKEIAQRTNNNLVNAVQSIKENNTETYESVIKPELEEWNQKYTATGEKIEDKEVINHIDGVLREYERK